MIELATRRNVEHVASGRAAFLCTTLEDADFGEARFDKIVGLYFPPMLRHDPEGTRRLVERLLTPGGSAHFF